MRPLILNLLLICSFAAHGELVVVVDQSSAIDSLTEEQVAGIFLGKTNRFPNGVKAMPVELDDPQLREQFYGKVSGKSLNQLKSYWATLVFTGKGKPPRVMNQVDDVVEKLPDLPGVITYLPAEEVTESMKVVFSTP